MSTRESVEVYRGDGDIPVLVGTLRPSFQGGRALASTSFQYSSDYLASPEAYAISPDLPLRAERQFTPENQVLFGAFADASPDQWGQRLIDANHAVRLRNDPSLPRRIGAFDYLLGVSDSSRMGALRLRVNSQWQSPETAVANLHDLDRVLAVARRYENDEASDEDLAYLEEIATSPGGARPKANILLPTGRLAIAKLPKSGDGPIDVEAWEALALGIARDSGMRVPQFTLHRASSTKSVLVLERFDRTAQGTRVAYISAATALGIGNQDGNRLTYQDFADTVAELSDAKRRDLHELFSRIALTVLINNVDDHWRNHGFLRSASGWELSPLFDVNPSRSHGVIGSRAISAADDPRARSIHSLLDTADAYGMTAAHALTRVHQIGAVVDTWRQRASELGIPQKQILAMASAFDEGQLTAVRETALP